MTKIITTTKFEEYLEKVQKYSGDLSQHNQLVEVIKQYQDDTSWEESYHHFFKGELHFYKGEYDRALLHYLQAKTIPEFQFYCYRASAYIASAREEKEKTRQFIERAFKMKPEDPMIKMLKEKIGEPVVEEEPVENVPLQEKEFEELSSIFEKDQEPEPVEQKSEPVEQKSEPVEQKPESTEQFVARKLGVDVTRNEELENRIKTFKDFCQKQIQEYLIEGERRQGIQEQSLHFLMGWKEIDDPFLTENSRPMTGGYFIQWNRKGIVINPGVDFLKNFNEKGLHIRDIDYVIVTCNNPNSYADIKKIYDLSYHLNKFSPEHKTIQYYLCQKVHQDLSAILKPNFKQERNAIHNLELFVDSPDVEKIEICPDIKLHYFQASSQDPLLKFPGNRENSSLGIKLEFQSNEQLNIGYITQTPWSPLLAHHLGACDILIASFGNTNPNDYHKLHYNEDCLGYHGCFSLMEEVCPHHMLCTEFDGREGDVRLEVARKMREEISKKETKKGWTPSPLPVDQGLKINLESGDISCNITGKILNPKNAHVMKTEDAFGRLIYGSEQCTM